MFELLGPNLYYLTNSYYYGYREDYHGKEEDIDQRTILRITRQILQALDDLHQAGYAHGGELSVIF